MEDLDIAIVGGFAPWSSGGTATYATEIARLLSKKNRVTCIASASLNYESHNNNLNIYIGKSGNHGRTLRQLIRCYSLKNNIDIFHMQDLRLGLYRFIDNRTPMVITCHGYPTLEAVANGRIKLNSAEFKFMRLVEKKAVERSDAIIAVDKRIYEWIIKDLNGNPEKIFHIPNGVDQERFHPGISDSYITDKYNLVDRPVILFLKALMPKNGPEIAIKAMKRIVESYPQCILLIVGDGPLKDRLFDLSKKLRCEKNIIFCGPISNEEAPFYYSAADIVVVPSVHIADVEEATSITMLEGMACAKPVVAANIGGLKEVIGGSENKIGILFEEGNYRDMAEKVLLLLGAEDLRHEIGKNARRYIERERNWNLNVNEVEKVYAYSLER